MKEYLSNHIDKSRLPQTLYFSGILHNVAVPERLTHPEAKLEMLKYKIKYKDQSNKRMSISACGFQHYRRSIRRN